MRAAHIDSTASLWPKDMAKAAAVWTVCPGGFAEVLSASDCCTTRSHGPLAASHTRSILSRDPDTIRPSGSTDTQYTLPVCPSSTRSHAPLAASHTRSVTSHDPDTTRPSGSTDTLNTKPVCPSSTR